MTDNRAVFLDRDGCINVEADHIRDIKNFRLYPDTPASIKKLNGANFKVVVITNQSGVARGYFPETLVTEIHSLLLKWMTDAGAVIDWIEYCPHHPDGSIARYAVKCECRKPAPGMILSAAGRLGIDLSHSYIVGDKISDVAMGPVTGAKSVLVRTGFGEREKTRIENGEAQAPDFIAGGIGEAVDWVIMDSTAFKA